MPVYSQAVIPAQAGTHSRCGSDGAAMPRFWIPACAGMTEEFAGMTGEFARMTGVFAGMTGVFAGMTGMTSSNVLAGGNAL